MSLLRNMLSTDGMSQMFSPFRRCVQAILANHAYAAVVRTKETLTNSNEVYLEREVTAMRKKNPAITDEEEVYRRS